MQKIKIIYIPIGVPTFHLESARRAFDHTVKLLKTIDPDILCPEDMLLSLDSLTAFLQGKDPDLAIVQNVTFANAAYISQVLRESSCPVLLWTLREPDSGGGRLCLNSLTGAFSAGNTMAAMGRTYDYLLADPEEPVAERKICTMIAAAALKKSVEHLNILQVGHTPEGFGFGRALDGEMQKVFGARLLSIEARELIDRAKTFSEEEARPYIERAKASINGLDQIERKNVVDFARLFKAYDEYTRENHIGALSSRCWPDFFTAFGTPVCAVLGMLNDLSIPAACEADTYGALSMYLAAQLTGKAAFFGDPVSIHEQENTVTFWHCGMAPCSLARTDSGACAGLHCNRKIGPTLEFGCKAEKRVTILRVGKKPDGGFRLFIAKGQAPDKPQQYFGTSIVVQTENPVGALIDRAVKDGWEPHFAVAMGDIGEELETFARLLHIEAEKF